MYSGCAFKQSLKRCSFGLYLFVQCVVSTILDTKSYFRDLLREGFKKKNCEKAVRLTAWVDPPPPLPRSGQENVKISRQVVIFGVILSFYKGQKWVKIFTNSFGQAGGG